MGLKLTRAGDYAIRAMIHLGSLPDGASASKDDIAKAARIPPSFTAKILNKLVTAKVLRSARGVGGGFALSRPASEINLLEIVEAIEGPLQLNTCSPDPERCTLSHDCPASTVWVEVQARMSDLMRSTQLEALVSAPRRSGRVVYTIGT
jgi:Rrf2 family protein